MFHVPLRRKKNIKRTTVINAIFMILLVVLASFAAIGWLRTPTETNAISPTDDLVATAKQEGTITVYGPIDPPDWEAKIKPAFLKLYPWATVNYLGLSTSEISARVISEHKAGKPNADVVIHLVAHAIVMENEGALAKYNNPMEGLMNYPDNATDPQGYCHPFYALPIVTYYNTNYVAEDQAPKSYTDFTDAKWKGKIVMEDPSALGHQGYLFAHLFIVMGNETWTSFMKALAANNPIVVSTASDVFQKLAMGEADIGIGYLNDYLGAKDQSVPVAIDWSPEPFTALTLNSMLVEGALHPAMAKLMIQFLAAGAGQYALASTNRVPADAAIAGATTLAGLLPPGKQYVPCASNNLDFLKNPEKWSDYYKSLFG